MICAVGKKYTLSVSRNNIQDFVFANKGSSLLLTLINFEQGSTIDLTPFQIINVKTFVEKIKTR